MKAARLAIADIVLLEPRVFADGRGVFYESFNARTFAEATGHAPNFVQDNHSVSQRGVLRGLHYQVPPYAQGKLVRCLAGDVLDVAVDIRRGSPTFGRWISEILSAQNRRQLWIPEGFAHAFLALSDDAEVLYKTTEFYHRDAERTIAWDDPALGIAWPADLRPILSEKDAEGLPLARADTFL